MAKLSPRELDRWIEHLAARVDSDLSMQLRKGAFTGLVFLEAEREALYGTPAPKRALRRR